MEGLRKSLQTHNDGDNTEADDTAVGALPTRTTPTMAASTTIISNSNSTSNKQPTNISAIVANMTHLSRLRKFISDVDTAAAVSEATVPVADLT